MKQILISMLLLNLLTLNSCSQETRTMLQEQNLKGKVKSVSVTNNRDYTRTYFDETGKIIRHEIKYETSDLWIKDEYTYDNNGRLMSYSSYFQNRPDEKLKYEFEYNKRGFLIRSGPGEKHKTYYKYTNGNCVLETQPDGTKIKRTYNKQNQVIEDFPYSDKGTEIHSWGTDEKGDYFEKDEMTDPYKGNRTFYKYNEHGDVSHITVKERDSESEYTIDVAYIYDDKGNWIERTTTLDGKLSALSCHSALKEDIRGSHFKRYIEYYE